MKSIRGTRTEKNLLIAFAGESQARNRYTYFASQARKEGYEQIAGIFVETADNEKEHVKRLFKFLEEFARVVEEEGFPEISAVLRAIAVAEKQHEKRYLALIKNIEKDRVFKREKVARWKCRNCGYISISYEK